MGAPLGLTAGSALGAFIADALSWRWAFVLVGLPGVLLALVLVVLVKEPRRGMFDTEALRAQKANALGALKLVFATPSLRLFTAAAAVTSFAGYSLYQWAPSFLIRSQGMTLEEVGAGLSPLFALGLVGSVAGGWIADRIGPNRPEAYGVIPGLTLLLTVPFFLGGLMVRDGGMSLIFFAIPLLLSYAGSVRGWPRPRPSPRRPLARRWRPSSASSTISSASASDRLRSARSQTSCARATVKAKPCDWR